MRGLYTTYHISWNRTNTTRLKASMQPYTIMRYYMPATTNASLTYNRIKRRTRTVGIEPTFTGLESVALPLYYARNIVKGC